MLQGPAESCLSGIASVPGLPARFGVVYLDPPFMPADVFPGLREPEAADAWLSMIERTVTAAADLVDAGGLVWLHVDEPKALPCRELLDGIFGACSRFLTVMWDVEHARPPGCTCAPARHVLMAYRAGENSRHERVSWPAAVVGCRCEGARDLQMEVPGCSFSYAKPKRLLRAVAQSPRHGAVLDVFMGSGTMATVATTLERPWVAVERDAAIIDSVAVPRLHGIGLERVAPDVAPPGDVRRCIAWRQSR